MAEENKTLIPIWIKVFLIIVLLLCLFILYQYVKAVGGGYSENPQDWGAFGSLLSGTFGLLASFAAVATLLIVIEQFGKQSILTERQLEAFEFDRYDKHRRIFFERIDAIEKKFNGELCFGNYEDLYQKVFPNNSPKKCEISIEKTPETLPTGKRSFKKNYERLRGICFEICRENFKISNQHLNTLVDLSEALQLQPNLDEKDGEIKHLGERTIFNAYDIRTGFNKLVYAYEAIAMYGGGHRLELSTIRCIYHDLLPTTLNAIKPHNGISLFYIHRSNSKLLSAYENLATLIHNTDDEHMKANSGGLEEEIMGQMIQISSNETKFYDPKSHDGVLAELQSLIDMEEIEEKTKIALTHNGKAINEYITLLREQAIAKRRLTISRDKNNPPS